MMISVKRHALLGNMCDKVSQDLTLLFPHKNKGSGSTQGKVEASSHIVLEDTRVGYIAHTLKVFSVKATTSVSCIVPQTTAVKNTH